MSKTSVARIEKKARIPNPVLEIVRNINTIAFHRTMLSFCFVSLFFLLRFTIAVVVGNRQFPSVVSKSKKEGKREAADAALRTLIAEGEYKTSASNTANAATNTLVS